MTRDFAWAFAIDDDEWLSSTEVSYRSASLEINTPFTQSGIQVNAIMSPGVSSTGEPFSNSDYNATINNATDVTPSTIYYDLDYSAGSITPINFDTVIAGTATGKHQSKIIIILLVEVLSLDIVVLKILQMILMC